MKKQDLLNSDFLKQFKTGEELNSFLQEMQKRGVEQLLEGEMEAHLGYSVCTGIINQSINRKYCNLPVRNTLGSIKPIR